jgi:hypothetical protein
MPSAPDFASIPVEAWIIVGKGLFASIGIWLVVRIVEKIVEFYSGDLD